MADFFRSSPPATDLQLLNSWISAYDRGTFLVVQHQPTIAAT
jgi:hypothetical protein